MSEHVVLYARGPAWRPDRPRREQEGWDAHAGFMDSLVAAGVVVLGGPLDEADGEDVLVVVEAPDADAVRTHLAPDPWVVDGVLAIVSVRPWLIWLRPAPSPNR